MLLEVQHRWITERFPFFDAERCSGLFHDDQEEEGLIRRRSGGEFPGIRLRNSVIWFPVASRRPLKDGAPIKAESKKGMRPLLYDTLEPDELVLVEGEADLMACVSVGHSGIVTAGGVHGLIGKSSTAKTNRAKLRGKRVRILFDPDKEGMKTAPLLAKELLEDGVSRVACVFPPTDGADVEEWLKTFSNPTRALAALQELLGSATWDVAFTDEENEKPPLPLQCGRFHRENDTLPVLAVMVYDDVTRRPSLAVYQPTDGADAGGQYPETKLIYTDETERTWHLVDEWKFGDQVYTPDLGGDAQKALDSSMLILPPPPFDGKDTSEALWDDLTAFFRKWFACEPVYYDVMAAYCLLTYRLQDARFEHIGFLRFVGPSGTGKGRGLDVMRYTCWRTYTTKPSATNLHRVTEYYGDFTMVIDEFHPGRGRTLAGTEELVDLLSFAFQRSASLVKMDQEKGGRLVPRMYSVFGPKILAGYEADEEDALTRRSIVIPTGTVKPTRAMSAPQFPIEAIETARALRSRLLAWRGKKLHLGLPDMGVDLYQELLEVAGNETAQTFWPLTEMVPKNRPEALKNILEVAGLRRTATREARHTTVEAYVLEALASLWEEGRFFSLPECWFIPTQDIADEVDREKLTPAYIGRLLKTLGLSHTHQRFRRVEGAAYEWKKGFRIKNPKDARLRELFERHGIEWTGELPRHEPVDAEV